MAIPGGTPDNSTLTLAWTDADGSHTASLPFRPTTNLLYPDLMAVSISNSGFTYALEGDDGLPYTASKLGRANIHVSGSYGAWSWNTLDLSANMIDTAVNGSLDDYVLKLEVLTATSHPLTENSPLQVLLQLGRQLHMDSRRRPRPQYGGAMAHRYAAAGSHGHQRHQFRGHLADAQHSAATACRLYC